MHERSTSIAGQLCSSAVAHDASAGRCAGNVNRGSLRRGPEPTPSFCSPLDWQRCIFATREPTQGQRMAARGSRRTASQYSGGEVLQVVHGFPNIGETVRNWIGSRVPTAHNSLDGRDIPRPHAQSLSYSRPSSPLGVTTHVQRRDHRERFRGWADRSEVRRLQRYVPASPRGLESMMGSPVTIEE
jgi:hypothetical protein